VRGLQDEAVADGLVVLVGNDDRDAAKLERYLTMMLSQKPAGVVLVGGQLREPAATLRVARAVQQLRDHGVPVVAVGRYELDIPHVEVDDASAAKKAVTHLLELGHRRIAFVGGPLNSTTVEDRYAGYVAALSHAGVPVADELVMQTAMTLAGGTAGAEHLIASGAQFTAVFAASDEVAYGVVSGLRAGGRAVPADVSVVGLNDVPMSAHTDPPLTTIHIPARELGSAAWRLLEAEWSTDGEPSADRRLPFELVVRRSTAPPATGKSVARAKAGAPTSRPGGTVDLP
jgi:LacI family repressor for deo operon, udp, cdd, tsx, nupC, and nupG